MPEKRAAEEASTEESTLPARLEASSTPATRDRPKKASHRREAAPRIEVPVVGIGYSAGGFDAFQSLLQNLDEDTGMAFVVIQHLMAGQESHLRDIVAKFTRMPVKAIRNGMRVCANHVYVIPPDFDVVLAGDFLNLHPRGQSEAHQLGIDFFLSSLSQNRRSKAIGVVLSGLGSDGTLGLKAIKSEGGITIVQDPKTAKFDGMPRSAIASGVTDLILAPSEIARELTRLAKHPYTQAALPDEPDSTGSEGAEPAAGIEKSSGMSRILDTLFRHTQVNFSKYKVSTIRRRIERQMMLRRIETIENYAEYLNKNTDEIKALYEDIFIHVTDFFRDPDGFEALRRNVFPALANGRPREAAIRVWVPGCATGEEAYSLAILMTEFLTAEGHQNPLQIFATDISEPAIQTARKGVYADYQLQKLSPERLGRFFEKVKDGYKIRKSIRDICIFSQHDVTSNPPIPRVDLISCRNVLIYFSADLQKRVFPVFHYALNPKGFLWLGKAENPGEFQNLFAPVDKAQKIYAKVNGTTPLLRAFSSGLISGGAAPSPPLPAAVARPSSVADSVRSADQVILYRYSPPSVVVDSHLEILQFRGRTVPYLEPPPGLATYSLLKMANPDISAALRLCVQAAISQNGQIRKEKVVFEFEGRTRKVNIDVSPLNPTAPSRERQYLIIFEEPSGYRSPAWSSRAPRVASQLKGKERLKQIDTLTQYNLQLQQELETLREYQQSLIEEYETAQEELTSANEELRSTNEELQSTNEELHSANEELGTAKEELQAANEELLTMNDELQKRNVELEAALKALEESEQRARLMIAGVKDYAIFMLDPEGRVASWNEGARRIKGYEADEIIGQHFSKFYPPDDIASRKPWYELKEAVRVGRFEDEGWRLRKDGSRFWANVIITPIVDKQGNVLGFSKVTRDLSERKRAEQELQRSRDEMEARVRERTAELARANEELATAVRARDEFLSIASHELKTPLTSMFMQTQLRWKAIGRGNLGAFTSDKLQKMVESDKKQLNRINRLIDDMLDVTRIASGKLSLDLQPVDLGALTREVLDRLAEQFRTARSEIRLDACQSVTGNWDRFRLEQVLVNLLTNAMKYGGGKPIQVRVSEEGEKAVLVVKDEGIGIAPEDQQKIFQQFERAANSGVASGLGLGLFIVKQIVEGHHGTIRLESKLNQGATFIVELPRSP